MAKRSNEEDFSSSEIAGILGGRTGGASTKEPKEECHHESTGRNAETKNIGSKS